MWRQLPRSAAGASPGVRVDFGGLHVSFANVLVAQHWAANWPVAWRRLAVEDILRHAAILYALNVAEPAQASLGEHCEHAWNARTLKDVLVGHSIPAMRCQGFVAGSAGGNCWGGVTVGRTLSRFHCRRVGCSAHRRCTLRSWWRRDAFSPRHSLASSSSCCCLSLSANQKTDCFSTRDLTASCSTCPACDPRQKCANSCYERCSSPTTLPGLPHKRWTAKARQLPGPCLQRNRLNHQPDENERDGSGRQWSA